MASESVVCYRIENYRDWQVMHDTRVGHTPLLTVGELHHTKGAISSGDVHSNVGVLKEAMINDFMGAWEQHINAIRGEIADGDESEDCDVDINLHDPEPEHDATNRQTRVSFDIEGTFQQETYMWMVHAEISQNMSHPYLDIAVHTKKIT